MGACASKPKDLDTTNQQAPAPVEAPADATPPQENNGGESEMTTNKEEEPLVDLSEPAEAPKIEEVTAETQQTDQAAALEEEENKPVAEEAKVPETAEATEDKNDDDAAPAAVKA